MSNNDKTKRIVKENLLELYKRIPYAPKKKMAEICGISKQAVTRWTAPDNSVPQPQNIKAISKYFHLPADWLLSDHSMDDVFTSITFYNDAFVALKILVDNGTLLVSDIKDPILQYLEGQAQLYLNDESVSDKEKQKWIKHITENFYYRIPPYADENLWDIILDTEHDAIYDATDEMQRYINLAKIVDQYYDRIQPVATDDLLKMYQKDSKNIKFLL